MDIDLDLKPNTPTSKIFAHWPAAMQVVNGRAVKHPCGVHPQKIPIDPISGLSAIPYKDADALGYFKIDMLHNSVYRHFESKDEIDALLELEPPWDLLKSATVVGKLFQLSKHFTLLNKTNPRSIEELADVLALIRPGKLNLLEPYLKDKQKMRKLLYAVDDTGYSFKKSHSIAYAYVIILQLHLVNLGIEI